jgi:two-component system response regulator FixJ
VVNPKTTSAGKTIAAFRVARSEFREIATQADNIRAIARARRDDLHEAVLALRRQRLELSERAREVKAHRESLCEINRAITAQIQEHGSATKALVASPVTALSPRQRIILDGILVGRANKVMAYDLGISEKTVETHRHRVMEKFGVSCLAELIRLCLLAGIGLSSAGLP